MSWASTTVPRGTTCSRTRKTGASVQCFVQRPEPRRTSRKRTALFPLAPEDLRKWIVFAVHYAFLQRDDAVVGDLDVLRADLAAAFGDVAQTEPVLFLGSHLPVCVVKGM